MNARTQCSAADEQLTLPRTHTKLAHCTYFLTFGTASIPAMEDTAVKFSLHRMKSATICHQHHCILGLYNALQCPPKANLPRPRRGGGQQLDSPTGKGRL